MRNAPFLQHSGRPAVARHRDHHERFSAVPRRLHGLADHRGAKLFHVTDHLAEKEDERIDVFLSDQRPQKLLVDIGFVEQLPRSVDGIGHPGEGNPPLEAGLDVLRQCRHFQSRRGAGVSQHDRRTTRQAYDPDPVSRGKDPVVDEPCDVEHLVDGVHGNEPILPEDGFVGVVRPHDRTGMGPRRPCPDVALADLDDHDGPVLFQGGLGGADERIAVPNLLHVSQHGARLGIADEVIQHLGQLDVRLVAGRGEETEAKIEGRRLGEDISAVHPALGNESERSGAVRAFQHGAEGRRQAGSQIDRAHRVRPADAHTEPFRALHEPRLRLTPAVAQLGETGAEEDDGWNALGRTVLEDFRSAPGGHRQKGQIDRARDIANRRVAPEPADGVVPGRDGVDPSVEAVPAQVLNRAPADGVLRPGRAHHRDRTGGEQHGQRIGPIGREGLFGLPVHAGPLASVGWTTVVDRASGSSLRDSIEAPESDLRC